MTTEHASPEELEDVPSLEDDAIEAENRRWANRRKLAFMAFYAMIVLTVVLLTKWIPDSRVDNLQDLFGWIYISFSSIVGSYMGLSTWNSMKGKK